MQKLISLLCFVPVFLSLKAQMNSSGVIKYSNYEDDISVLSTLNKQFFQNFLNRDTTAHNKIIYKDFICIASSGAIVNRNDYMRDWSHAYDSVFYKSFIQQNEAIRIFGSTALVMAETVCSYIENGKEIFKTTFYTDTYLKIDGRWYCVQAQLTGKK